MPTYQYRCTDCDDQLEVVQSFTDDALTICPSCDGSLRKVFNAVGVVFKGSGFYATDNRKGKKSSESASAPASSSAASTSKDSAAASSTPAASASSTSSSAPAAKKVPAA